MDHNWVLFFFWMFNLFVPLPNTFFSRRFLFYFLDFFIFHISAFFLWQCYSISGTNMTTKESKISKLISKVSLSDAIFLFCLPISTHSNLIIWMSLLTFVFKCYYILLFLNTKLLKLQLKINFAFRHSVCNVHLVV